MRKIRIAIIIVVSIIIIILIIMGVHKKTTGFDPKNARQAEKEMNGIDVSEYDLDDTALRKVDSREQYAYVKNCVEKFYKYYGAIYSENEELSKDKAIDGVYKMLDKDYIDANGIIQENVSSKIENIKDSYVDINQILESDKDDFSAFIVKGKLCEKDSLEVKDFEIMVKSNNGTFSVLLDDYVKNNYSKAEEGEKISYGNTTIDNNGVNTCDFDAISDQTYMKMLLEKYRQEALYFPDVAYENLNDDYKQKKFGNVENFKEYVQNRGLDEELEVSSYSTNVYDDYTEYTIIDKNDNTYIFDESSVMNYKLILDTYTINTNEFTTNYDGAGEQEKVSLDIQKILDADADGDYNYIYSKLSSSFKTNTFRNVGSVKQFLQGNVANQNVNYGEFKKINDNTYSYTVSFDDTGKTVIFVIKLLSNDDYELEFE